MSTADAPRGLDISAKASADASGASFLPNMQIVRFLAAAMVLISHLIREVESKGIGSSFTDVLVKLEMPWGSGVDLFFIVSGFLMFYLTRDHFGQSGYNLEFLKRRLIRVVPLYWLFTFAFTAIALMLPNAVNHGDVSAERMLASLFFFPIQRESGGFYPILALGWTLNYEMLFYLTFTAALMFSRRTGILLLTTIFLLASAANFSGWIQSPLARFWTDPIILEFVFGLIIAHLYVRALRLPLGLRSAMIACGFALLLAGGYFGIADTETQTRRYEIPRAVWAGLPCALIVAGFMLGKQVGTRSRLVRLLILGGDSSYALYLTHMLPMRTLSVIWNITGLRSGTVFFAAAFFLALAVSVGVFLWIERPLLKLLRRKFEPTRAFLPA